MKTIAALLSFGFFASVCGSCLFQFDEASRECARPYGFTEVQVFDFYNNGYSSADAPNVNLFVECVWRRWGFLSEDGQINFHAIKNTRTPVISVIGYCDDVPMNSKTYATAFPYSVDYCQRESPADVRAETIRSCIMTMFKERIAIARKELGY